MSPCGGVKALDFCALSTPLTLCRTSPWSSRDRTGVRVQKVVAIHPIGHPVSSSPLWPTGRDSITARLCP